MKNTIELTPRRKFKKTVRVKRLPRSGEHARRTGTGDGLPRTATEAVADVAHGWHVFFVVGVYSTVRIL